MRKNNNKIDLLKSRMLKVKTKLPPMYINLYEHYFGKQNPKQRIKIRECVNLRDSDEQITKNIETIVSKAK